MDTLTHIALGACIGELLLERRIGKKALLIGAIANSVPDIDFVAAFWMPNANYLLAHRGFTHSFLFLIIVSPFLAFIAYRWNRKHSVSVNRWLLFFVIEIFLHLFLDSFNAYGTGLLLPFSEERFSFNAIFVVDPFFSIWLGISALALIILKRKDNGRRRWAKFGLTISFLYLAYCLLNKWQINKEVNHLLEKQKIPFSYYFTTPTPFNNLLWYVVAKKDSGFYTGYRSVFDTKDSINLAYFPQNNYLLNPINDHEDLQHLIRFSKGYYIIQERKDSLIFNDLRFEQVAGWENPYADFVLYYYLKHPENNELIVQRGRFAGWNKQTISSFINRIKGN